MDDLVNIYLVGHCTFVHPSGYGTGRLLVCLCMFATWAEFDWTKFEPNLNPIWVKQKMDKLSVHKIILLS